MSSTQNHVNNVKILHLSLRIRLSCSSYFHDSNIFCTFLTFEMFTMPVKTLKSIVYQTQQDLLIFTLKYTRYFSSNEERERELNAPNKRDSSSQDMSNDIHRLSFIICLSVNLWKCFQCGKCYLRAF